MKFQKQKKDNQPEKVIYKMCSGCNTSGIKLLRYNKALKHNIFHHKFVPLKAHRVGEYTKLLYLCKNGFVKLCTNIIWTKKQCARFDMYKWPTHSCRTE